MMYEEMTMEELREYAERPIICDAEHLPVARYIGGDEWVGLDGKHYIVVE